MESLAVLFVVFAVLAFYIISIFNKLVALKNRFENAFSQIEVQLKRRYDLIPNLCLLYTSPSPRDKRQSRMPSSA